jgi:hypothetical protein
MWLLFMIKVLKWLQLFTGELLETNINRSPSAYLNNPAEERAMYKYDVDKNMSLLKFVDEEWGPVGSFSWFPVHGTAMNRTNELISSDNKGAASRFMEDWFAHSKVGRPSVKDNASIKLSSLSKQSLRRKSSILGTYRSFQVVKCEESIDVGLNMVQVVLYLSYNCAEFSSSSSRTLM